MQISGSAEIQDEHRMADLRMPWLAPFLLVFGAVFIVMSLRGDAKDNNPRFRLFDPEKY
jgi:hypothetical protein